MLSEATREQITSLVKKSRVVLFMKGNKSFPQCGFSAQVVQILKDLGAPFESVNVLSDPAIRDGIKDFAQWPTIPQLYVDGQFVGGCDIVKDLYASGELETLLGVSKPTKAPTLTISDTAAKAFKDADEGGDDKLRLEVAGDFTYELYFAPKKQGDFEVVANGVTVLVDKQSAGRADGIRIDFVGEGGGAFKIENPNEPGRVRPLSVTELKAWIADGKSFELFDVRTAGEREKAKIDRARWLDDAGKKHLDALDHATTIVFHCHHGGRSRAAAELAIKEGFTKVYNLDGGIDAWSERVDSAVPRY